MHAVSTQTTHNTAETQSVEAAGVEFAYRRFGRPSDLPLVVLQHFRGNVRGRRTRRAGTRRRAAGTLSLGQALETRPNRSAKHLTNHGRQR